MRRLMLLCCLVAACSQTEAPRAPVTRSVQPQPKVPVVRGPKLLPVDEAPREPSLVQFRNDLLAAVRRHDAEKVIAALDPKIRTSFGEGGGIEDFRRQWKIDQAGSPLWSELEQILTHGGTFQKGDEVPRFWAPYVYSAWPDVHDAFTSLAVIDKDVPLYRSNDAASGSIATLEYDIVTRIGEYSDAPMLHVRTADGREGWVEAKNVRSPVGYRAGIVRSGKSWKIETLVAGD